MQEEVICVQEQAIDSVRTLLREGRQGNIALRYVKMLKKCTPSWREAHFDDTTLKKHMSDRQNLNWNMRFLVKVIVLGTSLNTFIKGKDRQTGPAGAAKENA